MMQKLLYRFLAKIVSYPKITHLYSRRSKSNLLYQEQMFFKYGFDRELAISTLDKTLNKIYGVNYSEDFGMWSEHLILFAAIKNKYPKVQSILEIGTFDGQTARILSDLFPDSSITTFDLTMKEIKDKKIYDYAQEDNQMEDFRFKNLSDSKNVKFIQATSLSLTLETSIYDLIWVDGSHGYPIVAIDIANSLRLCSPNGFIMCDDVYTSTSVNDSEYQSTATYETLISFEESGFITFDLFLKRINMFHNINKKYIGLVQNLRK